MNNFSEIEHTADLGIEIHADSIEKLFRLSLDGYYSLVLPETYSATKVDRFNYSTEDPDLENLLIEFMSEINFYLMVRKQIVVLNDSLVVNKDDSKYSIEIKGSLKKLENPDEVIQTEIKAVTYHQIKIEQKNERYYTRIFFDI